MNSSWGGVVQYLLSFALVVGLLLGLLWALKRLQLSPTFSRRDQRLRVVETLSLGARSKIALVRCDGREVLVGITPAQITPLGSWRAADPSAPLPPQMPSTFPPEPGQ
jgi:flagellar biosynthetic protein FliO